MEIEKLIEKLRTESLYKDKATLEIMDLCMEAADDLERINDFDKSQSARLLTENGKLRAELEEAKQAMQEREKQRKELGLKHETDRIVLDHSALSFALQAKKAAEMTDIKRIINEYKERIEYFSHPENVNRITKHMEGGERREFMQHRKDEKLILSALKEYEERRQGCPWCNGIGVTPENWECSLVGEFETVTTADNEVIWTTASFCPSCGRQLKEKEDGCNL